MHRHLSNKDIKELDVDRKYPNKREDKIDRRKAITSCVDPSVDRRKINRRRAN